MIAAINRSHPIVAGWEFREFAANFSEQYFVILTVYADEAGTHDETGKEKGSSVPLVAGFFASVAQWASFSRDWEHVLSMEQYQAPHFHNKEFGRHQKYKAKNPFRLWDESKIASFKYDLALVIAGNGLVPVGGMYWAEKHHDTGLTENPHELAIKMFYNGFCEQMNLLNIADVEKILFIFDHNQKKTWKQSICRVHSLIKKQNPNVGTLAFKDDKDKCHLGLQAADLYAACCHERCPDFMKQGSKPLEPRIIDLILNRFSPKTDPANNWIINLPELVFRAIIGVLIEDEKRQKNEWGKRGLKQEYYPSLHFPYEKYRVKTNRKDAV